MVAVRTGQVFIEDFDVGIATTMGAELVDHVRDGETAKVYAIRIEGLNGPDSYGGLVPVFMSDPEDAYERNELPQIIISRGSISPDMQRWHPGGHEYQIPAAMAELRPGPGGRLMPNLVEKKRWTIPYEISYDVHLRGRLRRQADLMLRHALRFYWARGQVFVIDSVGSERGYYAFQESIENLAEVSDVADRLHGHTISLRVEGELDFNEPVLHPTVQRMTTNTGFR